MAETVRVKVQLPTPESFAPFGTLVRLPGVAPSVDVPGVLRYWDQVVNLNLSQGEAELGFLAAYNRPFTFTSMERHSQSDESFIPLEGRPFLFGVAPAGEAAAPAPAEIVVFLLDGSYGINVSKGVWHSAPFPLQPQMSFVLALRKGTVEEDIDVSDIGGTVEIELV